MTGPADHLASPHRRAALKIIARLNASDHTAYLAGGCVRDQLLKIQPKDYDVATSATPEQVQKLFRNTSAVGAAFGVILVREQIDSTPTSTEVATFRADGPYSDQRRPDHVQYSSPQHDAERRDFTINALFLAPHDQDPTQDELIDLVNGQTDLHARLIRAVGDPDRRLAEDHLRALRAVRFACRYDFEIEEQTANAINRHAAELAGVSRERIGDEVRKMLAQPTRARAATMMQDLQLDAATLNQPHTDRDVPTLAQLPSEANLITALLAWLIDRAGGWPCHLTADGPRQALMLSNAETDRFRETADLLHRLTFQWDAVAPEFEDLPDAGRKRLAAASHFEDAMQLLDVLQHAKAARIRAAAANLASDGIGLAPDPLIAGDDLVPLGFSPGPGFGKLLHRVYDHQLVGRIAAQDQAIALAHDLAPAFGVATKHD